MDNITLFIKELEKKEYNITYNQVKNQYMLYSDLLDLIDNRVENDNIQYDDVIQGILLEKLLQLEYKLDQLEKIGE